MMITHKIQATLLSLALTLPLCNPIWAAEESGSQTDPKPVRVKTETLAELAQRQSFSAPASVISRNHSLLSAELNARITAMEVQVGDMVKQGQLLVSLDCRSHQLTLQQSNARLKGVEAKRKLAIQQLQRARSLQKLQNASEELLNQRQAELTTANAERYAQEVVIASQQDQVKKCNIGAPFTGVITARIASVGELASPGTPLLQLLDTEQLEVSAQLLDSDIDSFSEAPLQLFRHLDRDYPLQLRAISPLYDSQTRSREARLRFNNGSALAGTSGRLIWFAKQAALPANYLQLRNEQLGVFIADETAHAKFVALPNALEGRPALLDLPSESRIITEGRFGLNDGDAIEVVIDASAE